MLTLRPTKMLARRLALSFAPQESAIANPYADWSVHQFTFARHRYLLAANTRSLMPIVISARGITSGPALIKAVVESIDSCLRTSGWGSLFDRFVLPEVGAARIASIESRSLLGSINELIYFASFELSAGLPPGEATFRLRQIPMTYLGQKAPEDIFPKMIVDQ